MRTHVYIYSIYCTQRYVYVHTYVCMCIHVNMYLCYIHTYVRTSIYTFTYVHPFIRVCALTEIYSYISVTVHFTGDFVCMSNIHKCNVLFPLYYQLQRSTSMPELRDNFLFVEMRPKRQKRKKYMKAPKEEKWGIKRCLSVESLKEVNILRTTNSSNKFDDIV